MRVWRWNEWAHDNAAKQQLVSHSFAGSPDAHDAQNDGSLPERIMHAMRITRESEAITPECGACSKRVSAHIPGAQRSLRGRVDSRRQRTRVANCEFARYDVPSVTGRDPDRAR